MMMTRTIKARVENALDDLLPTVEASTNAYNYVCKTGWDDKDHNSVSLHHKTYQYCKQTLPSALAAVVRVQAAESLKSAHELSKKGKKVTCPQSDRISIRYNATCHNVMFDKGLVSLLTISGRKKFKVTVPKYFEKYLDWRRRSATLLVRRGKVFLNIVFEKDVPDVKPTTFIIGVDRGIKKVAVTSNGLFLGGGELKQKILKIGKIRKALQEKGTKSAKRHLRKLSKKENRFRRDQSHCMAKKIVNSVPKGTTIVLEDLTNIRSSGKKFRKEQRYWLNSWNFFQLESFLKYKSENKECVVEHVDSRYTSQKCSKCGHIERGNRTKQSRFKCKHCGYSLNADYNASINISKNHQDAIRHLGGASVNKPIVASLTA